MVRRDAQIIAFPSRSGLRRADSGPRKAPEPALRILDRCSYHDEAIETYRDTEAQDSQASMADIVSLFPKH